MKEMKSWRGIVILTLWLALFACTPYPRESQRMSMAFEQAQLVYGAGENDTLLFIPELDKASAYYARKKEYDKAALAALYHGYAEKNYHRTEAMNAFKDAEIYGKLVDDSLTVAQAQYQIGKMLYYDALHEEALSFFEAANTNYGGHYQEKAFVMNSLAGCYILLNAYAKADSCLNQGWDYALRGDSDEAKTKILNNYAVLYQMQGEYDSAIACLRRVEPHNNQQYALNLLNLGRVFLELDEVDSAACYLNRMKERLQETDIKDETKASAYAALSKLAERQGDYIKALEYYKTNVRYIVKVKDRMEKEGVYRIQQQYDYEAIRNELNGKIIIRQRIILLMSLIIVMVIVVVVMLKKRLEKAQKQKTTLLTKQGKTMQKLAILMDNKENKILLDNLRANVFGEREPWNAIMEVFDTLYPGERERICSEYPGLSENELKDIILSYFDVSRKEEALLLKTSIHTVDKIRLSVKNKFVKRKL